MAEGPLGAIVLAAGQGKRLLSDRPKALIDVLGRPSVAHVIRALRALKPERISVVIGYRGELLRAALKSEAGLLFSSQEEQKGTAHAALAAEGAFCGFEGRVLIVNGDGPLVTEEILNGLLKHHEDTASVATMVSAELEDPTGYGRVVRDVRGQVLKIVEQRDADEKTRKIKEANVGLGIFESHRLFKDLRAIGNANQAKEYYLTDIYGVVRESGGKIEAYQVPDKESVLGFNSLFELCRIRAVMRKRIVERLLKAGVDIVAPDLVYIEDTVQIEPGATILPFCVFSGNVRIEKNCIVGPFTHLRPGTVLKESAEIGNFTEVKESTVGERSKAKHLTYLGDATVGADANIGAGTITANYDGKKKHRTTIMDKAFIGSGTVIIAPAEVGKGAVTGAGAIVTRGTKVEDGDVVVGVPARSLRKKKQGDESNG